MSRNARCCLLCAYDEEVSEIMKISAKYQVPVIAFGGGTSLEAMSMPFMAAFPSIFAR